MSSADLEADSRVADDVKVTARRLLAIYALLNAGLYAYGFARYGLPADTSTWACVAVSALVVVLLLRGSRGAWILSFLGSTLALIVCVTVLLGGDPLTMEWVFVGTLYATQVAALANPMVREHIRRTTYERAIRANRSW